MQKNADMLDAIFGDMTNEQILVKDNKSESDYYRPRIKDGKESYEAILKFLPNLKDKNKSIVNKWTIFLENPSTTEKKMIDCPSTIKQKSILQDLFFALINSDDASENDLKSKFSRKQQFYSLVQIIEDKQNPELEGKIKIFQYGLQVYDIIEKTMNPKTSHKEANNPFKLFSGKSFELLIEKQGKEYPRYTSSSFLNKTHNLIINGKEISNNPKYGEKIIEFFGDFSDKLLENEYKSWDVNVTEFIINTIKDIVPYGRTLKQVFRKYPDYLDIFNNLNTDKNDIQTSEPKLKKTASIPKEQPKINKVYSKPKPSKIDDDILDDDDDDEIDDFLGQVINEDDDVFEKTNTKSTTPSDDDEEDDDEFFK